MTIAETYAGGGLRAAGPGRTGFNRYGADLSHWFAVEIKESCIILHLGVDNIANKRIIGGINN